MPNKTEPLTYDQLVGKLAIVLHNYRVIVFIKISRSSTEVRRF